MLVNIIAFPEGRKIAAIKELRAAGAFSLAKAKEIMDAVQFNGRVMQVSLPDDVDLKRAFIETTVEAVKDPNAEPSVPRDAVFDLILDVISDMEPSQAYVLRQRESFKRVLENLR